MSKSDKSNARKIQESINGHALLIAIVLSETGIMATEPLHPRKVIEAAARAIEPIILENHASWVNDYNVLSYEVGDAIIEIHCERKADLMIIKNIQQALHQLSIHGAEDVSVYMERAIFPAITAMLTLNTPVREMIVKMIEQETSQAMRLRMKMDIARMTKQMVRLD
ncbi:hypothetical protein RYA05_00520 [Pseudomonas syringae pv. actinidiae]|nr:hypothetical protein [Pseudomonas syringae pv. actinidiae]